MGVVCSGVNSSKVLCGKRLPCVMCSCQLCRPDSPHTKLTSKRDTARSANAPTVAYNMLRTQVQMRSVLRRSFACPEATPLMTGSITLQRLQTVLVMLKTSLATQSSSEQPTMHMLPPCEWDHSNPLPGLQCHNSP